MFENIIEFIQDTYKTKDYIPLHEPRFIGNEKKYINNCIDSSFVSSVGKYVDEFENNIAKYIDSKYAIATCNGTSALHISLLISGVQQNDEVITQPLTFVATCNAISYCGAKPIFVDVDRKTMGLSPNALKLFLKENTYIKDDRCFNKKTKNIIKACIPMHTYGHPCEVDELKDICTENNIILIEDGAESLGSRYKGKHLGTYGSMGVMSFNGNKIITSGGGGCIVTNNKKYAKLAKHMTTTAKLKHEWKFDHDMVGYNYRMPNINAALLVAQLENLDTFILKKRNIAKLYEDFFKNTECIFFKEPCNSVSNYWLNTILLKDKTQRDKFLKETNLHGVMTRPIWTLMNNLPMYKNAECGPLDNAKWLSERVVNIPSSVIL